MMVVSYAVEGTPARYTHDFSGHYDAALSMALDPAGNIDVCGHDPVIMQVANSWLILNEGGGPTDDKPGVTLTTPQDPHQASAFLNIRVADIAAAYKEWSTRGAAFLTEPKDHGVEIRAYIRDPDGHLIEVGQSTGLTSLTPTAARPRQ